MGLTEELVFRDYIIMYSYSMIMVNCRVLRAIIIRVRKFIEAQAHACLKKNHFRRYLISVLTPSYPPYQYNIDVYNISCMLILIIHLPSRNVSFDNNITLCQDIIIFFSVTMSYTEGV